MALQISYAIASVLEHHLELKTNNDHLIDQQ